MKLRNLISVCLLSVYAMVMAHSFIPHHHHSASQQCEHHCELEKPAEHNCEHDHHHDPVELTDNCCLDKHQHNNAHTFCSFDEKIVLTKGISLSDLFLPSSQIEYFELAQNKHSYSNYHLPISIQDVYCRDVLLRGPPQFS